MSQKKMSKANQALLASVENVNEDELEEGEVREEEAAALAPAVGSSPAPAEPAPAMAAAATPSNPEPDVAQSASGNQPVVDADDKNAQPAVIHVQNGNQQAMSAIEAAQKAEEIWKFRELDLMLVLYKALQGANMANFCDYPRPQVQKQIPVKGMIRKDGETNQVYIQTQVGETKPVVFSDIVTSGQNLFVVKRSTQIAPHYFQVELNNDDFEADKTFGIMIKPFALPAPPSAKCENYTVAQYLEAISLNSSPGILANFFHTIGLQNAVDGSTDDGVIELMKSYAKRLDPLENTQCPNPLTNGKCVDLGMVQTANRDSDIRSYKLYISDAFDLQKSLETLIGRGEAQSVMALSIIGKDHYDAMMRQNAIIWDMYNKKNLQVATMAHFMLRALVNHYRANVVALGVKDTTNMEKAASAWLSFYVSNPVFFFKASNDLAKIIAQDKSTLQSEIPFIVRDFNLMLDKHVVTFLPTERSRRFQSVVQRKIRAVQKAARKFQYLPNATLY